MNILMIGNGFDLEHGLPTKYTDFLKFVKDFKIAFACANDVPQRLGEIKDEYLRFIFENAEYENRINALHIFTDKNLWIEYFNKVQKKHLANKQNWIDFESEISSVIQDMDMLIKYYEMVQTGDDKNDKIENYYTERLCDIINIYQLNADVIRTNIPQLLNDLNRLISALEVYIWDYVGNREIEYYNPDIEQINPDKVFSFNYSDTYKKIYAYSKKGVDYSFAHGTAVNNIAGLAGIKRASEELQKLYVKVSLEKNNMVLGIDEYLPKESRNKELDFIAFKKYYQRIYKQTGNEYKNWLKQIDENAKKGRHEENTLYVFGHSLDVTDGDVLREFINNENLKTVVFYRNKEQLGQQIANLVKIIESDNMIEKVYGGNPTIKFVKQSERKLIAGSPFEITSDIMRLKTICEWNTIDARSLLAKIRNKIKNKELKYFYSQKSVITLFDVLQKNGLAELYRRQLLQIAYELMRHDGLQEPEQFDAEEWGYCDYDNSFGCDPLTQKFVNTVNLYNINYFVPEEKDIQGFDEELELYQKLIESKEEIDKAQYIEIITSIFYMFYDKYANLESMWSLLVRISRGPGEKVAKSALNELIKTTEDELDIVHYNHLLSEIEMNEYFTMKAEEFEQNAIIEE